MRARERLGQIVPRSGSQRLDTRVDAGIAGDHDDDRVRVRVEAAAQQPHARDLRHAQIQEHDVEAVPLEGVAGFVAAAAHAHLKAFELQHAGAALSQRALVVDDQHADTGLHLGSELGEPDDLARGSGPSLTGARAAIV